MKSLESVSACPRARVRLVVVGVTGWAIAVLAIFAISHASMFRPFGDSIGTVGLASLTVALFQICGWRILCTLRKRVPKVFDGLDAVELLALEMGLGVGAAMLGLFAMGALGLYSRGGAIVFLCLLGACIGHPAEFLRDAVQRWRSFGESLKSATMGEKCLGFLVLLVGVMTCLQSLTPETSQDALVYHLAAPALYVADGGLHFIPGNFYASFPQNVEMLYTLALLFDDASLAAFYHWWLGVGAALGVAVVARRISGAGSGLAAAAIFVTVPSVALVSTWAYVELGVICFQMLAVFAYLAWRREGHWTWIVLAGVFAGLDVGCKYTGGAIGLILLALILLVGGGRTRDWRERLIAGTLFGTTVFLVVLPWLVKNVVMTGNPMYPFLFGIFGGTGWDAERAAAFGLFLKGWGGSSDLGSLLTLPFDLTFAARFSSIENFDGMIGPIFLLGSPLIVVGAWRCRALALLVAVAGALLFLWLMTTHQIRFLLPALACLAATIGASITILCKGRALQVAAGVLGMAVALNGVVIFWHFLSHNPLPVVFGLENEESYLLRETPGGDYPVFLFIERQLEEDARIFLAASGNPGFLCQRSYYMDALFENHTLSSMIDASPGPDELYEQFKRGGFTHVLFRWDLIFDPQGLRSGLELGQQKLFASFLNAHARLELAHSGTSLYRLVGAERSGTEEAR